MPNRKITELNELFTPELLDVMPVVDTSEPQLTAKNKKISIATLTNFISGIINSLPVVNKGDLLTHNGTNETQLGVGSDGQILAANSSTSTGLEWQTILPQPLTFNEETINSDKSLGPNDNIYQHLITTTASLEVFLPSSPINGTRFVIKNSTSSTESFIINSVVINPGELYEIAYTGTQWVEL